MDWPLTTPPQTPLSTATQHRSDASLAILQKIPNPTAVRSPTISDPPHNHHPDPSSNGLGAASAPQFLHPPPSEARLSAGTKRQRRPSVRLGEIGEQPASAIPHESYIRRCKQLNVPVPTHYPTDAKVHSSKTRPLTHLVREEEEEAEGENFEPVRRAKVRRGEVSRVKSNRRLRGGEGEEEEEGEEEGQEEAEAREFGASVSPVKERSYSRDLDAPLGTNQRNRWYGRRYVGENNGRVKSWLHELGLGRYTPVFEIHEVDDEVLHMLTLEDLKDMGIHAVGSRRKMFSAIQKLRKGVR